MAKAILVMDMPESCFGCNFCHINSDDGEARCQAFEVSRAVDPETFKKPIWCPLRELPEKKKLTYNNLCADNKVSGWNACLDEILKERKE